MVSIRVVPSGSGAVSRYTSSAMRSGFRSATPVTTGATFRAWAKGVHAVGAASQLVLA
jgi:hypothetical protein